MADAGRVAFLPKGDYKPEQTYDFLDFVYYQGKTYVAKQTTTGNAPTESDENWQVLVGGIEADDLQVTDTNKILGEHSETATVQEMFDKITEKVLLLETFAKEAYEKHSLWYELDDGNNDPILDNQNQEVYTRLTFEFN